MTAFKRQRTIGGAQRLQFLRRESACALASRDFLKGDERVAAAVIRECSITQARPVAEFRQPPFSFIDFIGAQSGRKAGWFGRLLLCPLGE